MLTNDEKLNNTVMVYISTFDSGLIVRDVEPAIRNDMIQRCNDDVAKRQRYCVWKLLDYALFDCYGKGVKDFNFVIDGNGAWKCDNGVKFSLTHCNNVVAVAVCNQAVGVDLESVAKFAHHANSTQFAERVLTEKEQIELLNVPVDRRAETLAQTWTKKESIFKLSGGAAFIPKSIDATTETARSKLVTVNGERYALSVATNTPSKAEIVQVKLSY